MSISTATVLFTDLVGSTELAVRLGAEFDGPRRAHDTALRSAVEANGGTVIKGMGDGVMATFGAAADALAAARAAQQSIHRLNRQGRGPALSIRVGLSAGDVSFEETDCYGEPVIEAARLCAAAGGDRIFATDIVRTLAGCRRAAGFAPVGLLELKGLPDPLPVVEVLWEREERSTTPLPARLAVTGTSFVGRAEELDLLHRGYEAVRKSSQRQVVLVGGEPGLGKTTVVAQAVRAWHEAGATVAMGWCEEDVRAPYRPFIDALAHLVAAAPPEVLHAHVARQGGNLLPLVPGLANRLDRVPDRISTDPESERFLLFSAVADLLTGLSELAPIVLFLDDLHWADAGTASLLRSLATASEPARLLIVGTFRSDELKGDHPMGQALAAFRRVPAVSRLHLGGLSSRDVVELLEHWTGADGGAGAARLASHLVAETDGNAFFVTEVVRHLDETGQLADLSTAAPGAQTLMPDSVREVLGERVARLGSHADEVLAAAAVIGSEFGLGTLGAVTGMDESKMLSLLADASTAALVREVAGTPGRFQFTHALVQHAILANLGATREASLHRRVAEALETDHDAGTQVAELAHHWLQATRRSDSARARDWARQAGEDAMVSLAPGDAVAYFRQALLLHDQIGDDDVPMRIDLLTRLGTAERQAGDPEHRDTLLKAARLARREGDGARLAAAALANNSGTFSVFGGLDTERIEMLEAAIEAGQGNGQQALLLGTLANELTYSGDFARRRRLVDEALAAARASGDPSRHLHVLNLVYYPLWVPETLDERLAMTEESLALVAQVDDPVTQFWTASTSQSNLAQAGRVAESDPHLTRVRELADRLAQPALQWRARHIAATRHLLAGDPAAALPLAQEALDLGTSAGEPVAGVYFKSQEMCVHWQRGTMAELSDRIKGTAPRSPNAAASLCLILAESGRDGQTADLLAQAAEVRFSDLPRDPALIASLAMFAEGAILLGDARSAAVLHELLAPFGGQVGIDGVTTVGALEHYLGALATVLGRSDEAVERLQRACDVHHAIAAPFFEARSRHRLAAALLARDRPGDAGAAAVELGRAVALAERHGYGMVHRRAAELLAHTNGG
jgi:class 3 adenylate cyclase/tetratricopeptide (TPR) repeat protein